MKKIILIALSALGTLSAWCVPARPGIIEHIQPKGDTLRICLRGDERSHWIMTEDGYQVDVNQQGALCYAIDKGEKGFKVSKHVAHNKENRSRKEMRFLRRRGVRRN